MSISAIPTKHIRNPEPSGRQEQARRWEAKATPRGECVYLMLTDKAVQRCGAKCEGQRCEDHPQGVRVHFNIGGKGGAAL